MPRSIAVFCGAAPGHERAFADAARELGQAIARSDRALVYGGGSVGLMGAVADGALLQNGRITGVITRQLVDKELAHKGVTDMRVVETMHDRKMMMASMAEAFIALPGGFGTLDEFFEILAWAQLRIHHKPVGVLDVNGFFDPLLTFLDRAGDAGFLRLPHREFIVVDENPTSLLERLTAKAQTMRQA
ncbi:MAG: TIGR00730 family Rossman fold protein [Planctomycetes bacterium]|nr:TIGR00730 family Rossman fold protein [Planctomycetota bacterium]